MKILRGFEKLRAKVAVWLVVQVASRIHSLAVLSVCKDIWEKYMDEITAAEE